MKKTEQEYPESFSAPWETTFPHVIRPRHEESLPGVLLRCDEMNEWPNGTTVRFVYELAGKGATVSHINFAAPKYFPYREFAGGLGITLSELSATTYLRELQRLFPQSSPHPRQLGPYHRNRARVCPLCLQQQQLQRAFVLPGITLCPAHHVVLHDHCGCGAPLTYFVRAAAAWSCHHCATPWQALPQIVGQDKVAQGEYRLFHYYRYFLEQGTDERIAFLWASVSQWLTQRHLMGLALPDGSFLQASFVQQSVSFSLYRLILALLQIEQQEPGWSVITGIFANSEAVEI